MSKEEKRNEMRRECEERKLRELEARIKKGELRWVEMRREWEVEESEENESRGENENGVENRRRMGRDER